MRTADFSIRVIATNLISGTVTVRAQSKAKALAEVEQRINPKLRQEGYEYQIEFLETVELTQSIAACPRGNDFQVMEAALERNGDGAGVGREREHKNEGDGR